MSDVQELPVSTPEPVETPVETAPTETPPVETKQPEAKTFTEDDVNKIVQKRLAKESRRIQREVQLEVENNVLRQQQQPPPKPAGEPKVEDFKDYDSYNRALIKAEAENQAKAMFTEFQRAQQAQAERQAAQAQIEKITKSAAKYDDFQEVVMHDGLPIDHPTKAFITESDHGADVAYYLGKNLAEAHRISQLSPVQQIRELSKIEAKFTTPAKTSAAPEPIKPIGSGASLTKDIEKMSMAEYKAYRAKHGARF